jgi:ADP-ribose pyrophosphatase YjhB (NUDIX family)
MKKEKFYYRKEQHKKKNPNKWSKTGGHVVFGEEPKESLKREIEEGLGAIINDQDIKLISIYKSKEKK